MKIEYQNVEVATIEEFADKHDLTMVIKEMEAYRLISSFSACFKGAEIKNGGLLIGACGYGESPAKAIQVYSKSISGKIIVVNAFGKDRKEIKVPRLI